MREVDVDGLLAACADPFVQHHLQPTLVVRAWVDGPAAVVEHRTGWPDAPADARAVLCLGPAAVLDGLVERVAAGSRGMAAPWRVVAETTSHAALPPSWRPVTPHRWHWMTTRTAPAAPAAGSPTGAVTDAEVDAVLDAANPASYARPSTPGLECWVGVRDPAGEVVAVGALLRQPHDGTGHLRGITTLPAHRGRGHAAAVSADLTRRALARGPGLATLGVFTDNVVAIGLYERLGYAVGHTFVAGLTEVGIAT